MEFRIADTFTDSLAKLTGDEQKVAKTTAFDLQINPANPGLQLHRIERAKDANFWSIRVSRDIRLIIHKTNESLLLCYVAHHDPAYHWAQKRKLQTHPTTGAAQIVEIRETVREIKVPRYVDAPEDTPAPTLKPALFAETPEEELLGYGVPPEWIDEVHKADEDSLLELTDHLPREAAEALLELATGGKPQVAPAASKAADPFEHPDAKRRFRVMTDVEELERALEYPWEKWTVFLHPAQQDLIERQFNGPARVSGSAGTGKTIVALHRAAYLAKKHPEARVLVTTFSETLANALTTKLKRLVGNKPGVLVRIEVDAVTTVGKRLYTTVFGKPKMTDTATIRKMLSEAAASVDAHRFSDQFIWTEWREVVDAWQLDNWDAYRDVPRLGRKTRLGEQQRQLLWAMFEQVRGKLADRGLMTMASLFSQVTEHLCKAGRGPYDFAVIDEAQDISVPELRFMAALGGTQPDTLFFTGDLGQRIFQTPFSWKSLGVDVRGRSRTLRINYRTSHQIRRQADRLLPPELADVDGITEDRRGTVSVFNGPEPSVVVFDSDKDEANAVAKWLTKCNDDGFQPHEIGVFVRSREQLPRAMDAIKAAGLKAIELTGNVDTKAGHVSVSPMHLAKGLEFRAVVVMACDDEILPLQDRIEAVVDDADLEDVYNTERHLLYVACTRARDRLMASGVEPASEFLDDLHIDVKA